MSKRKILRLVAIAISVPIAIFLLLVVCLYLPPVQDWAVRKAAGYASDKTGYKISIEKVRLSFPLDLVSHGVLVMKPNSHQQADTIASIGSIDASIRFIPLLHGEVVIDAFDLCGTKFNTLDIVDAAKVHGNVSQLSLNSKGIDLLESIANIDEISARDANIYVSLPDTVPPDTTTSEPSEWKLNISRVSLDNVGLHLSMNSDTLTTSLLAQKASINDIKISLKEKYYRLGRTDIALTDVKYDNGVNSLLQEYRTKDKIEAIDYNHLCFNSFNIGLDSLLYADPNLVVSLHECNFKEQSGLSVKSGVGQLLMDSSSVEIPNFTLYTASSRIGMKAKADFSAFDSIPRGRFSATIQGDLSSADIKPFIASMPKRVVNAWPSAPLHVAMDVEGNMDDICINKISASMPRAFSASLKGRVKNATQMDNIIAQMDIKASTQNMSFATSMLDPSLASTIRIPAGLDINADVDVNASVYKLDLLAKQRDAILKAKGNVDIKREIYNLTANAKNVHFERFMPSLGLAAFSGDLSAHGSSFDILSSKAVLTAKADINNIAYDKYRLGNIKLSADVANGKSLLSLQSQDSLLYGNIFLHGLLSPKSIDGTMTADITNIDLYKLGLTQAPLTMQMCGYADLATNMKSSHSIDAALSDIVIRDSSNVYTPRDVEMKLLTNPDTTIACLTTGDFDLDAELSGGYENLINSSMSLSDELIKQFKERYVNYPLLRDKLPIGHIKVEAGQDNMIARFLTYNGITIASLNADLISSPSSGLNGMAEINSLESSGVKLDYSSIKFNSTDQDIRYAVQVKNTSEDNPYKFNALLDGGMAGNQSSCQMRIYDNNDNLGLSLSLQAMMEAEGLGLTIKDLNPILGYKKFTANADNRIFFGPNNRVEANVKLVADDGTGVMLYSDDENSSALQDLTLSLHKLDIGSIISVVPYAPPVDGIFTGDFHAIQTEDNLSISTEMNIDSLVYDGNSMGDMGSELVYMPLADGTHHVDGILSSNGIEVANIDGNYNMTTGYLNAEMQMDKFPLSYANGFIPDQIMGLKGYGGGELSLKGTMESLDVNGELSFDDASLYSLPYGVDMRFDEKPVEVKNSKILLDNFSLYARDNSPLSLSGNLDFSDFAAMSINMRMQAKNFKIIDAKENSRSETFGKAYVDFFATAVGPLETLQVKGLLNVLGSTDMTYILRDSPLTTDNQLDELVKFTNFSDTIEDVNIAKPTIEGLSMDLTINVDESAHILCALNAAKTNYVDLVGSGNLRMQYTNGDIRLVGQYTLNNGEMKYSLPIIPLKTFTIQDGSSVEFTGDPFNPRLDITATEQVKAPVTSDDGTSRNVNFTTGVIISKTLNDMGLEFTIDAPEDLTLHNELQTMSVENRGKIAVTMLTTGMYLADGNTSSFSLNNALSAFLNSQINNISAGALRTLDLSFDMNGSVGSTGEQHTDYSFKFAKRFWNNRLRIVIGGKLSSGDDVESQNNTFFDNVTFEYRLSSTSNKYLNLFYKRDSYDWLEGYVSEFGAGFLWRRKMQNLSDMFKFKKKSQPTVMPSDSISNKKVMQQATDAATNP